MSFQAKKLGGISQHYRNWRKDVKVNVYYQLLFLMSENLHAKLSADNKIYLQLQTFEFKFVWRQRYLFVNFKYSR